MMKGNKFWILVLAIPISLVQVSCGSVQSGADTVVVQPKSLLEKLQEIPSVSEVNVLKTSDHFTENYELWFEQHVDPTDLSSQTFKQRVLLAHVDEAAPVVVEIQGYQIWSPKAGELAKLFQGNQISIEHRFFADSKPNDGIPWEYLTVKNAASDQHNIIQSIKEVIYSNNRFVSTGISKGGQTTMIHRSMYPDDVDASVCYVAPLNFEREESRIYEFLNSVGTLEQRKKISDFQTLCFEKKAELLPLFEKKAKEKKYEWNMSTEKAFEFYVLEYSFAFWQWGAFNFDQIPDKNATADSLLNHALMVSGVSFFEEKGVENLRPFFWAALTELGMYGYDHRPFAEYLSEQKTYTFDFSLPDGKTPQFDPKPMAEVNDFIQTKGQRMMFIYGGLDTWGATAVDLSEKAKMRGLKKYVLEKGHHGTRIRHFNDSTQKEIKSTLEDWLGTKADLEKIKK